MAGVILVQSYTQRSGTSPQWYAGVPSRPLPRPLFNRSMKRILKTFPRPKLATMMAECGVTLEQIQSAPVTTPCLCGSLKPIIKPLNKPGAWVIFQNGKPSRSPIIQYGYRMRVHFSTVEHPYNPELLIAWRRSDDHKQANEDKIDWAAHARSMMCRTDDFMIYAGPLRAVSDRESDADGTHPAQPVQLQSPVQVRQSARFTAIGAATGADRQTEKAPGKSTNRRWQQFPKGNVERERHRSLAS